MIRRQRSHGVEQPIAIVFERFDGIARALETIQQRLVSGLFMIEYTISGLPVAVAACWPLAITLDLVVRSRLCCAKATRRERGKPLIFAGGNFHRRRRRGCRAVCLSQTASWDVLYALALATMMAMDVKPGSEPSAFMDGEQ